MNTFSAFAMGKANRGREEMVFDWDEAARIIKEKKATKARAGLRGDWEWTGGKILENGKPVSIDETYVFLASTWAVPELEINGERIRCYKMQSETPNWNSGTYWPESALAILNKKEKE